jgi:hypothetical protein
MTNSFIPYAELPQDALGADETSQYQALYDFYERTGRPWDTENALNNQMYIVGGTLTGPLWMRWQAATGRSPGKAPEL